MLRNPDIAGIAGFDLIRAASSRAARSRCPGDIMTAMEQTPDFFKTAKEGWVDGIVVRTASSSSTMR